MSDSAAANSKHDRARAAFEIFLENYNVSKGTGYNLDEVDIVADDVDGIRTALFKLDDRFQESEARTIFTCGGTGICERDVTPEALVPLFGKRLPALEAALMSNSLRATPHAMLSRPVSGILKQRKCLVVALPGSPKAISELAGDVFCILPHLENLLLDKTENGKRMHSHGEAFGPASFVSRYFAQEPTEFISVMEQLSSIRDKVVSSARKVDEFIKLSIIDSCGYVLAKDVESTVNIPSFRTCTRDGYVIHKDAATPGYFQLKGCLAAGSAAHSAFQFQLGLDECVRVNTGCVLPDYPHVLVVMREYSRSVDEFTIYIEFNDVEKPVVGQYIRPVGSDIKKGETVLSAGLTLSASKGHLGLAAACGVRELVVCKPATVSIIVTGNEIVSPFASEALSKSSLKAGEVFDANGVNLYTVLKKLSCRVLKPVYAKDTVEDLARSFSEAIKLSDTIVVSGGISMGEKDLVRHVLETEFKAEFRVFKIPMRPGHPFAFAIADCGVDGSRKLFFALPGNPLSTLTTLHLFVIPTLQKNLGSTFKGAMTQVLAERDRELLKVKVTSKTMAQWVPVKLVHVGGGAYMATGMSFGAENSTIPMSSNPVGFSQADALMYVDHHSGRICHCLVL